MPLLQNNAGAALAKGVSRGSEGDEGRGSPWTLSYWLSHPSSGLRRASSVRIGWSLEEAGLGGWGWAGCHSLRQEGGGEWGAARAIKVEQQLEQILKTGRKGSTWLKEAGGWTMS